MLRSRDRKRVRERRSAPMRLLSRFWITCFLFKAVGRTGNGERPLYGARSYCRDRILERWISTVSNYQAQDVRVVCYLSAEFLTGPHLANNLINLGIYDETEQAMRQLGMTCTF